MWYIPVRASYLGATIDKTLFYVLLRLWLILSCHSPEKISPDLKKLKSFDYSRLECNSAL